MDPKTDPLTSVIQHGSFEQQRPSYIKAFRLLIELE